MTGFLSFPLKKSYEVDLAGPLRSFISSTYSTSDEATDGEAINEFNKLRSKACVQPLDRHDSSLEILYRYYDQLVAIESKLPLTPTQIPVPFKWKDAFEKGLFGGRASLTLSSGGYEKACVMFNIAALQTQVAAAQRGDTDDELKLAAKLFQQAAGILSYLKDYVLSMVQQDPTADLMPDTLAALSALCLAQAQEAIYLKAAKDQMKAGIVAKIASQAAELYAEAARQLGRDMLRSLWERDWMPVVNGKQFAFQALAQYQQSLLAKEAKEIGEELSRLQQASQWMTQAQQQFSNAHVQVFKTEAAALQKAYELAKKDNDFIYHERIPDIKQLPVIGKAPLAKTLPVGSPMSPRFKDLFERLVPVAVHQALARYDARRGDIVNMEVGRLREHTQLMNAALASLNLPAALEDVCNEEELPESIREKSAKVKSLGGIQKIAEMIGELPTLLKRNREILDETVRILTEERSSDDQLRQQFGARWTRMPSEKLTEPLWQEVGKYKQILDTANNADNIVRQKYEANKSGFETLSKPEPELRKTIPGLVSAGANKNSAAVGQLKQLMQAVEEIRKEREKLEKDLKDATFDMTSTFLKAMAESGALSDDQISITKLNEIYGPIRETISNSVRKQESVMGEVQVANTQFCQEKGSNSSLMDRENALKTLVSAHDAYLELLENLKEGTKFYNDLTPLLLRLQQKVSDFNFARKTEKEDLMKDLQQNIVNQPASQPPQNPGYHGGTSTTTTSNQPPPRPPPPRFSTAPSQSIGVANVQPSMAAPPPQQSGPYAASLTHNAYMGPNAPQGQAPPGSQAPPLQYSPYPYPAQPNFYATYPPPMPHPQAPYPTGIPPYPQPGAYGYPPAPSGYNPYAPIQQPQQGAPQWQQ